MLKFFLNHKFPSKKHRNLPNNPHTHQKKIIVYNYKISNYQPQMCQYIKPKPN